MRFALSIRSLLFALVLLAISAASSAQIGVGISIRIAPPEIPVYTQPIAPGDGYIWTPGYWAWTDDGYQWVDGAWVLPPYTGALWTPGYWGYGPGGYLWNAGYWGPTVGYYGGINYGFGYFGTGFYGGYWGGGHYWYNRAYNNIGWRGGYAYNRPYAGFNGRPGGVSYARAGYNAGNRGSFVGSNHVASNYAAGRMTSNFAGSNQVAANHASYRGFGSSAARPSYNGASNYSQPHQSFAGNNGGSFHG